MKKLSRDEMKNVMGGFQNQGGNSCSADCPTGSSSTSVSCPADTKVCSASNTCVTCDGTSKCCTRA